MKVRKLIDSFNDAIAGLIHSLSTQRNMKIHFALAFIVLFFSNFFNLDRIELLIILFAISLVIVCEMLNTAIEAAIDIFTDQYHPLAKIAKNVAAGAVLVSSINAIVVAYFLFFEKINNLIPFTIDKVINSPAHLTFISLILIVILIISIKAYVGTTHFLKGGIPSGHSAVAFGCATAIMFITRNILPTTLSLIMALLVAESRVEGRIHSTFEVIIGAIIGIIVVVLVFQIST